jgi:asparagine synthase (glutamine-hydrolysing)
LCGITGFSGNFERFSLDKMNEAIAHRGPDDSGTYWLPEKGIGLAHRRLSIIDLSPLGHQPMWDATQTVVIVFNGEIFNYRELRADLVASGYTFKSHTDTEVLLNLYLRDGEAMLSQLNGMFAFALWDTRTDSLFLARDGIGVKPLYYTNSPNGFLFASELKALLQEPSVERSLDLEAIHYYLTYLWCPAPHTMLKAIKKLEPGHALIVKDGQIQRHWQFYDLPYQQDIEPLSEEEAVEQLQTYLKQAVKRQMVSDVPVGAFLSGGLDSSSVVALAKQHIPDQRLQCFTIGFKDSAATREGFVADLPYAQQAAKHLDVDLHTIYVGSEMAEQLEKMIYQLDEPQADPAPLNVLFISQLARQHGIKVLLSGAGGDDIFTGYRRHYALMQERYWAWMPKLARKGLSHVTQQIPVNHSLGRRVSKAFRYADLDSDERIASYFYWLDRQRQHTLYSPALQEYLSSISPATPLVASLAKLPAKAHTLNQMLYLEGKHFLADHNLNYTDKMSMATGVEVRVPLLDPDLIALAARLPVAFKQRGKTGKWIFKKAMEPYLPSEIIYRPKTGFGAPVRQWLRHQLCPLVEDVLSDTSLRHRGLFDPREVQRLVEMDRLGRVDGTYTIFSLMCIEIWCRIFIDRKRSFQ